MGAHVLLLDDAAAVTELLAREIESHTGCTVTSMTAVEQLLVTDDGTEFDVALVNLVYAHSPLTGLDAFCHLHATRPATKLAIVTRSDEWVIDLLHTAWEAFPIAAAISKHTTTATFIEAVDALLTGGRVPPDPVLAPLLPPVRSPWRSIDGYRRLIQHAGHAKLWRALCECSDEPTYRDIAHATGLSVNTVRNYRDQLLGPLAMHGLTHPSLREMRHFARRVRPLLRPFVDASLARSGAVRSR